MARPFCTAFSNAKGGVGRTTLAVNTADRLAAANQAVMLVDAGDQYGVGTALGVDAAVDPGADLTAVVRGTKSLEDVIVRADDMDVVPGVADAESARRSFGKTPDEMVRFVRHVVDPARDAYDHVLVDLPPEVSPITDAALVGADQVVMPTGLNRADLSGLVRTIEHQIVPIRRERRLPIIAIVPNRLRDTAEERRALQALSTSPLGNRLFGSANGVGIGIPERTGIQESWEAGVPYARYVQEAAMIDRFDRLGRTVMGGSIHG